MRQKFAFIIAVPHGVFHRKILIKSVGQGHGGHVDIGIHQPVIGKAVKGVDRHVGGTTTHIGTP